MLPGFPARIVVQKIEHGQRRKSPSTKLGAQGLRQCRHPAGALWRCAASTGEPTAPIAPQQRTLRHRPPDQGELRANQRRDPDRRREGQAPRIGTASSRQPPRRARRESSNAPAAPMSPADAEAVAGTPTIAPPASETEPMELVHSAVPPRWVTAEVSDFVASSIAEAQRKHRST